MRKSFQNPPSLSGRPAASLSLRERGRSRVEWEGEPERGWGREEVVSGNPGLPLHGPQSSHIQGKGLLWMEKGMGRRAKNKGMNSLKKRQGKDKGGMGIRKHVSAKGRSVCLAGKIVLNSPAQ